MLLIGFYSCTKTVYISSLSFANIASLSPEKKILTIINEKKQIVFQDTIVGELMYINKAPRDIITPINQNTTSKNNNVKTISPYNQLDVEFYIIWMDEASCFHSRKWAIEETVSTKKIILNN